MKANLPESQANTLQREVGAVREPPLRNVCFPVNNWHVLVVGLVVVVGVLLRAAQFGQLPPGLYHDEAWNGLDALETLETGPKLFYPNNFGREPFHIWLVALAIRLLGRTPAAVRLPSLLMGALALPACYLLSRELFGRRVALWASAIMAFTLWPIHLSRISFRAADLPAFVGFGLWLVIKGYKTSRWRYWITGGVLYGISFYTYLAARFTPFAMALFLLYLALTRQLKLNRSVLCQGLVFALAALVTILPLASYAMGHPDEFLLRMQQTTIFTEPEAAQLGYAERLVLSIVRTLGIFNVRGDLIARHNFPARPVFDMLMGLVFLIGCASSLQRLGQARHALVWIWVLAMLGPNIWSTITPGFLRTMGIWPVLAILPAMGIEHIWGLIERRFGSRHAWLATGVIILASLSQTVYDYFWRYPHIESVKYAFEDAGLQLTHEINSFLETGWTRGAIGARRTQANPKRRVYVDHQVWKDWLNARMLIPPTASVIVPGSASRDGPLNAAPVPTLLYAWGNPDYPGWWLSESEMDWLPSQARIQMRQGPLATTDMVTTPHTAYIVFTAMPYDAEPAALAHFEVGVDLAEADVRWENQEVSVRLGWLARRAIPQEYTVFVHAEQGGAITAQSDRQVLGECQAAVTCFPMTYWRPGDIVVDEIKLTLPTAWNAQSDKIWVGLYHWPEMERLDVTSDQVEIVDKRLLLFPTHAH